MSEHHAATATETSVPTTAAGVPVFDQQEIKEFDQEDTEAGRNICKMLSLFFFYTVIVMCISTLVTYKWILQ